MKTVIVYQVQNSSGHWGAPQCYVPSYQEDYNRCKSYDEECGMHFIKEFEVSDDTTEINILDYVSEEDNVLEIEKHTYLIRRKKS